LTRTDGVALPRAATQRRTIGLLSLLAATGEGGLSRDKIIGIMWPEVSARRARHSLTQALYAARKALECDDLFVVSEDIRLNPDRISSDVAAFQAAVSRGDDPAAAELYRGPFLDGFYLSSPEFEQWLSGTRDRLELQAVAVLERLSRSSEAQGDLRAAVGWLGRIAAMRPSDAGVTMRLMQLLAGSGDRARAIEHAESHVRILREEYEIEPDPQVLALAESLRTPQLSPDYDDAVGSYLATEPHSELATLAARDGKESLRYEPEAEFQLENEFALQRLEVPESAAEEKGRYYGEASGLSRGMAPRVGEVRYDGPLAERPLPSGLARRIWYKRAAVVAVLALLVILVVQLFQDEPLPVLDQRIVVAPFRVHDADASLSYLSEGLVDLLSTRLADDENARGVDAGAVLRAWHRAGITRASDASRDTMMKLAARFGAERLIIGSVVGGSERAVLSASVVHVPTGVVSGEAVVEGPIDSLVTLADQLAGKLLLSQAGSEFRLAGQITHSLPALRSYLSGMQAYAHGDHAVAAEHYARALRTDSTFALAALRMAMAAERLNDFESERRALAVAWREQEKLSDRDRAHLHALLGPRYPEASSHTETIAAWEQAASLGANSAEVWYGFARAIIESGQAEESEAEQERARAALERTLDLDAHHAAARMLLAHGQQEETTAGIFALDSLAADSAQPLAPFLQWRRAAAHPDTALSRMLRDSLAYFGPANLRAIAAASQFDAVRLEDGARAIMLLLQRAASYEQAFDLLLAQHAIALNRDRPAEALQASARLQRLSPATRAHLRLRVLDAVFANGDSIAGKAAAEELERGLKRILPPTSAASDACALAQWQLATQDTAGARVSLEFLETAQDQVAPVGTPAAVCRVLARAGYAVATRSADAQRQVAALDSLVFTTATAGDAVAWANIAIARMHTKLNNPVSALRAIRRRPYMSGAWPRYHAAAVREEELLAAAISATGTGR